MKGITDQGFKIILIIVPALVILFIILAVFFNLLPFFTHWACCACTSTASFLSSLMWGFMTYWLPIDSMCDFIYNCSEYSSFCGGGGFGGGGAGGS